MALKRNSSPAFLSANRGTIERLLARGAEWRRQHGDKPVPMKTLRAWSLPTRKATSVERRQWLEAITADPNVGNGRIQSTAKSITWLPPLTASSASFAPFDADQMLRSLHQSLVALRASDSGWFYAAVGVAVHELRDSLDLRRLNDPSVSPTAIRAMLLRSIQPFMTPAESSRLNAWERLFQQFEANLLERQRRRIGV